jgi:hypothetical protein
MGTAADRVSVLILYNNLSRGENGRWIKSERGFVEREGKPMLRMGNSLGGTRAEDESSAWVVL